MKFVPIKNYTIKELIESGSTFSIVTKSNTLYDECKMHHMVMHDGSTDTWFETSSVIISAMDVLTIAFEEPHLDPKNSVLKLYVLNLGWMGSVVVTAYTLEEAHEKMLDKRCDIGPEDLGDVVVHTIDDTFVHVNYGDS
jgi:hypothetical protein